MGDTEPEAADMPEEEPSSPVGDPPADEEEATKADDGGDAAGDGGAAAADDAAAAAPDGDAPPPADAAGDAADAPPPADGEDAPPPPDAEAPDDTAAAAPVAAEPDPEPTPAAAPEPEPTAEPAAEPAAGTPPAEESKPKKGAKKTKKGGGGGGGGGSGGGGGKTYKANDQGPQGSNALKEMQDKVVLPDRVVQDLKRQQREHDEGAGDDDDEDTYDHTGQRGIPRGLRIEEQDYPAGSHVQQQVQPSNAVCDVCGMQVATAPFCVMTGVRHNQAAAAAPPPGSRRAPPPYQAGMPVSAARQPYPVKAAAGGSDVVPQHVPAERGAVTGSAPAYGTPQPMSPQQPPSPGYLNAGTLAQQPEAPMLAKRRSSMASMATTLPECHPSACEPINIPLYSSPVETRPQGPPRSDWDRLNAYSNYQTHTQRAPQASSFQQKNHPAHVLQRYDLPAPGDVHTPPPADLIDGSPKRMSPTRRRPSVNELSRRYNDPNALLPSPYGSPNRYVAYSGYPTTSTPPPPTPPTYSYSGAGPLPSEIIGSYSRRGNYDAQQTAGRGPLPSEAFAQYRAPVGQAGSPLRPAAQPSLGVTPPRRTLL